MHQIFLRAIGCNWLVCLAVFLGIQAKDLGSKVVGMWWPVFALVSLGMAHVVANMFFVPLGIWMHTPGLSVGLYIWKENIIEGSLFCGVYYWYQYLLWDEPVAIDSAVYGEPMFESHHHLPHIHFPEFRRKSVSSDEETRIGSRRPSHC